MFDDIVLNLEYVFSDKEVYYAKKKEEEEANKKNAQAELNALIKPEHKTVTDLVNIYCNRVNENVELVKINL